MSSSRPAPGRAAAIGLSAGMVLGALVLTGRAIMLSGLECAPDAGAEECHFEQTLAADSARFFSFFALGLALLGIGVFVLSRPRKAP